MANPTSLALMVSTSETRRSKIQVGGEAINGC
jgi:hypothetical protein